MGKKASEYGKALAADLVKRGLPAPVQEHEFHPTRKWRFDMAWPDLMIAVEVEGWGKHHQGFGKGGFEEDCRKYNQATLLGWTLLRFTTDQVRKGEASMELTQVFEPLLKGQE